MSVTEGRQHTLTWRIHPLVQLHWRRWDDEWVVFDVGSGQTHQMDTLTAVTLLLLENEPASAVELARKLADELVMENAASLSSSLAVISERLATAGLIEHC